MKLSHRTIKPGSRGRNRKSSWKMVSQTRRNLSVMSLVPLTFLIMFLTPLLFMSISGAGNDTSHPISRDPRVAKIVEVPAKDISALDETFQTYLINGFTLGGGYPGTGATLEDTYYALQSLSFFPNINLTDPAKIESLVAHRLYEDGGYRELDQENATISSTFFALQDLELSGKTLTEDECADLANFVENCIRSDDLIGRTPWDNTTSPEIMYYGLKILDWIAPYTTIPDIDEDTAAHALLEEFYQPASKGDDRGLFAMPSGEKFRPTYFGLLVMNELGTLDYTKERIHTYIADVEMGDVIGDDNQSLLHKLDGEIFRINSTDTGSGWVIEVDFEFSLDEMLQLSKEDHFSFYFTTEISSDVDRAANLQIYNNKESAWEYMTPVLDSSLKTAWGDLQNFIERPEKDNTTVFVNDGIQYDQSGFMKFFFNSSTNFWLDIDALEYEITIFDLPTITEMVNNSFFENRFELQSLAENYYAMKILEFLGTTDTLTDTQWDATCDFLLQWQLDDGYFRRDVNDEFSSIEANLYVYEMLAKFNTTTRFPNDPLQFLAGWQFPDGGFGSTAQTSLVATYRTVEMLASAGNLSVALREKIAQYVNSCRPTGQLYYDDRNPEFGAYGDTYFAYQLGALLEDPTLVPDFPTIATDVINAQIPSGTFTDNPDVADFYYACQIIRVAGKENQIHYPEALRNYVRGLQLYYGGFLKNPQETIASVAATSYGVLAAQSLDFLSQIRVQTQDNNPGALEYLLNHQDTSNGGFYEVNPDLLAEEEFLPPTYEITNLVCQALSNVRFIQEINSSGLNRFINDGLSDFNEVTSLVIAPGATEFFTTIKERALLHEAFILLNQTRLQVSVSVDDDATFPEKDLALTIVVTDPWESNYAVEGCIVTVKQAGTTIEFIDHQNGTYTAYLVPYTKGGRYTLEIACLHEDYLGVVQDFILDINSPFDLSRIRSLQDETAWFSNTYRLRVPLFNESDGTFAVGCNASLFDNQGNFICQLEERANESVYTCQINFSSNWYAEKRLTLRVSGELYRTENVAVRIRSVTVGFVIFLVAVIVGAIAAFQIGLSLRARRDRAVLAKFERGVSLNDKEKAITLRVVRKQNRKAEKAAKKAELRALQEKSKIRDIELDTIYTIKDLKDQRLSTKVQGEHEVEHQKEVSQEARSEAEKKAELATRAYLTMEKATEQLGAPLRKKRLPRREPSMKPVEKPTPENPTKPVSQATKPEKDGPQESERHTKEHPKTPSKPEKSTQKHVAVKTGPKKASKKTIKKASKSPAQKKSSKRAQEGRKKE